MTFERDWEAEHKAYEEWQVAKELVIKAANIGRFEDLRDALRVEHVTRERFRELILQGNPWQPLPSGTTPSFAKRLKAYLGSEFTVLRAWLSAAWTRLLLRD